jgi:hypothetical protein
MSDYPETHWDADAGQWVPPASQPRHSATAILALAALGLALAQPGEDDATDYGYYDTPSGNLFPPGAEPGQPPATNPGGRAAGRAPRQFQQSWAARWSAGREKQAVQIIKPLR